MEFNPENIRILKKEREFTSIYQRPVVHYFKSQSIIPEKTVIIQAQNIAVKEQAKEEISQRQEQMDRESPFKIESVQPGFMRVLEQLNSHKAFYEDKGEKDFIGHFLFIGAQGTGKTSAANSLALYLNQAGFCATDQIKRVTRKDLVGQYIGETAQKTQKIINETKGGVLFVDEAYTLFKGDVGSRDFGVEALETLMEAMEKQEVLMIFGGYRKQIHTLLTANLGLEERFKWQIDFDEIRTVELVRFAKYLFHQKGYTVENDAEESILRLLEDKRQQEGFAYLRTVKNMVDGLVINKPYLYEKTRNRAVLSQVTLLDMEGMWHRSDPKELETLIEQLNQLTGLNSAKEEVAQYLSLVDYNARRRKAGFEDAAISGHMLFVGNPGTGKTTVARLIGRILGAKGYLTVGHVIEVTRGDLVSSYVGGTPQKTKDKIKEAWGGVLFIDEAYSLVTGSEDRVGFEALDTLVKEMEDKRGNLVVILAGYEDEMKRFMQYNPGFESRVTKVIHFSDYSLEEFADIFRGMIQSKGYEVDQSCEENLRNLSKTYYKSQGMKGNGRSARNLFEALIKCHAGQNESGKGELNLIDEETLKLLKQQHEMENTKKAGAKAQAYLDTLLQSPTTKQ